MFLKENEGRLTLVSLADLSMAAITFSIMPGMSVTNVGCLWRLGRRIPTLVSRDMAQRDAVDAPRQACVEGVEAVPVQAHVRTVGRSWLWKKRG